MRTQWILNSSIVAVSLVTAAVTAAAHIQFLQGKTPSILTSLTSNTYELARRWIEIVRVRLSATVLFTFDAVNRIKIKLKRRKMNRIIQSNSIARIALFTFSSELHRISDSAQHPCRNEKKKRQLSETLFLIYSYFLSFPQLAG